MLHKIWRFYCYIVLLDICLHGGLSDWSELVVHGKQGFPYAGIFCLWLWHRGFLIIWILIMLYINKSIVVDLAICVLGMILNSTVVVQGAMVKLRPCLCFRACGWGCVRWKTLCRKGCGKFVKLTWLVLLILYYILCDTVTVSPNQIIFLLAIQITEKILMMICCCLFYWPDKFH